MNYTNPQYLVSTEWLAANLDDSRLRVLDCTVYLRPPSPDAQRTAYVQESGRADYEKGHIPGAAFADLVHDLSDRSQKLPFMMPTVEALAEAMGRYGVGDGHRVICYDNAGSMWAARVWWMLRAAGFEDAAVLDGGLRKWRQEGRALSTEPASFAPATLTPVARPDRFASKADVLGAIGDGATCVINALTPEQHRGDSATYGRAGRIAGSVNVSARDLVDRETGAYLPADVLAARFQEVGATRGGRIITYCGGGIAATSDALVLTLLGHDNVAVYDGSMSEWARDPEAPMEVG